MHVKSREQGQSLTCRRRTHLVSLRSSCSTSSSFSRPPPLLCCCGCSCTACSRTSSTKHRVCFALSANERAEGVCSDDRAESAESEEKEELLFDVEFELEFEAVAPDWEAGRPVCKPSVSDHAANEAELLCTGVDGRELEAADVAGTGDGC